MGGPGSGNFYHWHRGSKKTTVERCLQLDTNLWTREGILRPDQHRSGLWQWTYSSGATFSIQYEVDTRQGHSPMVHLEYWWTWTGSAECHTAKYPVRLTTTRPHFGGLRWWFICPLVVQGIPCQRRVGKLYLPGRARYFGCRRCYDLTYTSCQEGYRDKWLARLLSRDCPEDYTRMLDSLREFEQP
jgi:hypothetical protein